MLPVPFACNASNIFLLLLFLAWTLEVTGDADFDSVKVKMTKNTSGRWDSRIKYWRESGHPIRRGFTSLRRLKQMSQRKTGCLK